MELERFDKVFIHQDSLESPIAQRLQTLFAPEKIEVVSEAPYSDVRGTLSAREFNRSKRQIYVTPFKGHFFKRCPGSKPGLACCNYYVLNLGLQCDMNCSYCYLQSFINSPLLTVYSNLEQALDELRTIGIGAHEQNLRIGTGETIDSLSLDDITLYSRRLIEFFRDYPKWRLEFKTKSKKIDQFLNVEHASNVIVSWSINPTDVVAHEEHGTATLAERLDAAERCLQKGFIVAFHIDPVIWHTNWKQNYLGLVDELHRRFDPEQIPYISLGALRFQPEQRHMMRERFGLQSWVTQAEVWPSEGGKLRYDKGLRNEMFQAILGRFKELDPRWKVFLCMETPESWLSTFEAPPRRVPGLAPLFEPQSIST